MSLELFDIHNYFERMYVGTQFCPVIGNNETRMSAALLYPLRNVSIVLRGEAGSGKTTVIRGIVTLVWGSKCLDDEIPNVLVVSGSSEKGLLSDDIVERIASQATHCVIPELENIVDKPQNEDVIKCWTDKTKYIYRRAMKFGQTTQNLILRPLPVLTSLANENQRLRELGEEMERRLMPFYMESNLEVNRKVHKRKAEIEAYPDDELFTVGGNKLKELREHFEATIAKDFDGLTGPKIKNPCAPFMSLKIPKRFTVSNTYIVYWHDMVKAVTSFYNDSRPTYTSGGYDILMSTPTDNYMAWLVCGEAVLNASLRLRDMGRVILHEIPILETGYSHMTESDEAISLTELVGKLADMGYERSRSQIKELVMRLLMANYINATENEKFWKSKDFTDQFDSGVSWTECVEETKKLIKEHYPKLASDYISTYCEDPVCIHPFTGEKIHILDTREKKEGEREITKTRRKIDITKLG